MKRTVDWSRVRKHSAKIAKKLFDDFDKRRSTLLDIAREFYPLGVAGLEKSVDDIANGSEYDEDHKILTTIPITAMRKGAAGFHGNLTSPARRWFKLRLPSFMLDGGRSTHEQRDTLDRLTDATEWVMQHGNIYSSLYKLYEHCLTFGFGCMLINPDANRVIRSQTLRIGTYALGIDEKGAVNRCVRKFAWTAEQIISEFGSGGATDEIKRAAEKGDLDRRWTVINLIEPNAVGNMREYDKIAKTIDLDDRMIYRSIYFLDSATDSNPQSGVLHIAGFTVEPIVAPRFDCELGDTYGRGRGIDGLDAARGCQSFKYDTVVISGNRSEPAVIASADLKEEGLRLERGAVNYARFGEQKGNLVTPIFSQMPDTTDSRLNQEDAKRELDELFFVSSFTVIDALKNKTGVKTATEIDQLVRENMESLAPVVTNFDKELLDPLVSIVVRYTIGSNISPISPDEAAGLSNVNIEYVSQIHLAQKQSTISSVQNYTQFVTALAGAKPEALDKIDTDGTIDKFGEMIGVPESCVSDEKTIQAAREARAAAAQAQAQAEMQLKQAQAAKQIGDVPIDDGHAGGAIVKGMGA